MKMSSIKDSFLRKHFKTVRKILKNRKLVLEFFVLGKPNNTPAFYNFMNHADFGLGTGIQKEVLMQLR